MLARTARTSLSKRYMYYDINEILLSSLRPDNQIIMVFLILTFYLIFFAGFADIVDYLPIRYRKAEALSGIGNGKDICRRYRIVADIVTANIGKIGCCCCCCIVLQQQNRRIGSSPTFTFIYLLSICFNVHTHTAPGIGVLARATSA